MGHRSIDNMAILIASPIKLTDEQLEEEMAMRRERLELAPGQATLGCPLCGYEELPQITNPSWEQLDDEAQGRAGQN
ncbi:MAG: hypothetical protein F4Y57_04005 [Acidobacteria bacterium]|nr:hypothetical protein [Acidobacteriota bacterium]